MRVFPSLFGDVLSPVGAAVLLLLVVAGLLLARTRR
jgi:hypothetical protein